MRVARTARFLRIAGIVLAGLLVSGCGGGGDPIDVVGDSGPLDAVIDASDTEVETGQTVYLSMYNSTGNIYEVGWEMLDWPAASIATLDYDGNIAEVWLVPDVTGTYTVRMTIYDQEGRSDSAEIEIHVVNAGPDAVLDRVSPAGGDPLTGEAARFSAENSSDPDNDTLTYSWAVTEAPSGSTAAPSAAGAAVMTFTADKEGWYEIELTVADRTQQDTATYGFYASENLPPVIVVADVPALLGNDPVHINASESEDPNGRALTFDWELVAKPDGSLPELEASGSAATLAPDGPGTYDVHLTVSDGTLSAEQTFSIASVTEFVRLEVELTDAEYDEVNDRIVLVSWNSRELITISAENPADVQRVTLNRTPLAVSVSPDGSEAVVAHDALLSIVDLSTMTLSKELAVSTKPIDVVHGGNGFVHAFPSADQWSAIHSVEVATANETLGDRAIFAGTLARKQPGAPAIYGAINGLSPADIEKYDIGAGPAMYAYDSPYHGDYSMCGNLWFTEDGAKIITACGNTFYTSDVKENDMKYAGALERPATVDYNYYSQIGFADHSTASGMIATVESTGTYYDDNRTWTVNRYDATTYALHDVRGVPVLTETGTERALAPMFVFHQAATDKLLVVADIEGAGAAQTIILAY